MENECSSVRWFTSEGADTKDSIGCIINMLVYVVNESRRNVEA
jgi:hypothetical protein